MTANASTSRMRFCNSQAPFLSKWLLALLLLGMCRVGAAEKGGRYTDHQSLVLFCEYGRLDDRGIAITPFAGSVDRWVLHLMEVDLDFAAVLRLSPPQREILAKSHPPSSVGEGLFAGPGSGGVTEYDQAFPDHAGVELRLDEAQRQAIQSTFLCLEGLMALRRKALSDSVGLTDEQRQEIVALVNRCWNERVAAVHQAIFSLSGERVIDQPKLQLLAREASADLDREILEILSEEQHERLLPLVKKSESLAKLLRRPTG